MFDYILLKLAELSLKKRELLQSKYPNIDLSLLEQCDPTPTSEYINWIIKLYLNKTIILPEDQSKIYSALKRYTLGKKENKFPQQYKDINIFKSYGDLAQALDQYLGKDIGDIKVMEGYNNSRILYNQDGWEVIQVNDVNDLVNLSQGTKWCTKGNDYAEDYLKDGFLYLINRNNQRYCLIHPASNQMKNVYDDEFRGEEEQEIINMLVFNNILPTNDLLTILTNKAYLERNGFEKYHSLALEKGKKNSNIAYCIIRDKVDIKNENISDYFYSALKKPKYANFLLSSKIIEKDNEYKDFYIPAIESSIKNPQYAYELFYKKTISKDNDLHQYYIPMIENILKDPYYCAVFLRDKIITEDNELNDYFIPAIEKSVEDPQSAYFLLNYHFITIYNNLGNYYRSAVLKAAEYPDGARWLLKNNIIKKDNSYSNLYYPSITKTIEDPDNAFEFLTEEIITKSNQLKNYFDQAFNSAIVNQEFAWELWEENIFSDNLDLQKKAFQNIIQDPNRAYSLLVNKTITRNNYFKDLYLTTVKNTGNNVHNIYYLLTYKFITRLDDEKLFNQFFIKYCEDPNTNKDSLCTYLINEIVPKNDPLVKFALNQILQRNVSSNALCGLINHDFLTRNSNLEDYFYAIIKILYKRSDHNIEILLRNNKITKKDIEIANNLSFDEFQQNQPIAKTINNLIKLIKNSAVLWEKNKTYQVPDEFLDENNQFDINKYQTIIIKLLNDYGISAKPSFLAGSNAIMIGDKYAIRLSYKSDVNLYRLHFSLHNVFLFNSMLKKFKDFIDKVIDFLSYPYDKNKLMTEYINNFNKNNIKIVEKNNDSININIENNIYQIHFLDEYMYFVFDDIKNILIGNETSYNNFIKELYKIQEISQLRHESRKNLKNLLKNMNIPFQETDNENIQLENGNFIYIRFSNKKTVLYNYSYKDIDGTNKTKQLISIEKLLDFIKEQDNYIKNNVANSFIDYISKSLLIPYKIKYTINYNNDTVKINMINTGNYIQLVYPYIDYNGEIYQLNIVYNKNFIKKFIFNEICNDYDYKQSFIENILNPIPGLTFNQRKKDYYDLFYKNKKFIFKFSYSEKRFELYYSIIGTNILALSLLRKDTDKMIQEVIVRLNSV